MVAETSRRDRHREQTVGEIKQIARRQLTEVGTGGIALRAIAREMGMTAPGLYRYYASLDDLITALILDCYEEVVTAMEQARDALPADSLGARLHAASRAFRTWSVGHPVEFGLIFGAPLPGYARPPEGALEQAGARFAGVFRDLFVQIWARRPFPLPDESSIDPRLVEQLERYSARTGGRLPVTAVYLFVACWVRMYGAVAMEVFGRIRWALEEGGALFETELRQLAELLGITEEYALPPAPSSAAGGA
ncbi:MAG: TetR/AcrR family transcriptional regulator [Pseudonocardiales bacterium]|nr:MAG: TetR/AcrR family transcriptional regulator [Pseudonocardiales bacterium]